MTIPAIANEICGRFHAAFEARCPGRLRGLYLVGSIALDDFQPGRSDVDFVSVTREPVTCDDVAPIHAALATLLPSGYEGSIGARQSEERRARSLAPRDE